MRATFNRWKLLRRLARAKAAAVQGQFVKYVV